MKTKRAWLIRWDMSADKRDGLAPGQILTFLDARLSDVTVVKIMRALWVSHSKLMWRERLAFAVSPRVPTFVIRRDDEILVGSKPRLVAKIVHNIEATDEEEGGCVRWAEYREKELHYEMRNLPHPS